MVRHFEEELNSLKERLLAMGKLVESMINNAIRSIIEQKEELKNDVIKHEDEVNRIQIEIDDNCITLIALQQPTAIDLRFITSAMKINSDLERMGDQAINIIDHSIASMKRMPQGVLKHISLMSQKVEKMVRDSLDSFIKKDVTIAKAVLLMDDEVDTLKEQVFKEMLECMKENAEKITHSLDLVLISRNLERIGDHATNISEDVIYMVLGKDIRHHMQEIRK